MNLIKTTNRLTSTQPSNIRQPSSETRIPTSSRKQKRNKKRIFTMHTSRGSSFLELEVVATSSAVSRSLHWPRAMAAEAASGQWRSVEADAGVAAAAAGDYLDSAPHWKGSREAVLQHDCPLHQNNFCSYAQKYITYCLSTILLRYFNISPKEHEPVTNRPAFKIWWYSQINWITLKFIYGWDLCQFVIQNKPNLDVKLPRCEAHKG